MRKDPTEFKERFQRWKNGEQVYENGLTLPTYEDGKDSLKYEKAFYNAIDPRQGFPESKTDAILMQARVWNKYLSGDNTRDYDLEPELADSVSDAAFRKRLGLPYDKKFLPVWNGDTVRLPKPLEAEIPTDTTFLKNRIASTKRLMNYSRKYRDNEYIKLALEEDQTALDALRKTYATGRPVGINEHSFNSRRWVNNGEVTPTMSPLNVLAHYNIRYDKDENKMYYSDSYDFNEYDDKVPGKAFRIRGNIDFKTPKLRSSTKKLIKKIKNDYDSNNINKMFNRTLRIPKWVSDQL